jgi:dTDP-4-dehydrorhamnose 3,5-epimerase
MLRADDRHFEQFGEIYFSLVNPGAIKAWRRHRRVASFLAVPMGEVRLVLFDDRPGSATAGRVAELQLGRDNYSLVTVPPGVWSGCQALGTSPGLLANCATEPHDPAESETRPPSDPGIPYQWAVA